MTNLQETISFQDRVAIVTGGGNGLGRSYCLALTARGAKVVVNDVGVSVAGDGHSSEAAVAVVDEIRAQGGQAIAAAADVTDADAVAGMVASATKAFGRVDILITSAGIIRDKSFGKMSLDQFDFVANVDVKGAAYCARAAWPVMKEQGYGRIVLTTSGSALFGNFGQANYAAGKLGVIGLMNVLKLEGMRNDIRINAIAPAALTRMSDAYMPDALKPLFGPERVAALALYLASTDAPNGDIISAGGGYYGRVQIMEGGGVALRDPTPEDIRDAWSAIADMSAARSYRDLAEEQEYVTECVRAAAGQSHD